MTEEGTVVAELRREGFRFDTTTMSVWLGAGVAHVGEGDSRVNVGAFQYDGCAVARRLRLGSGGSSRSLYVVEECEESR